MPDPPNPLMKGELESVSNSLDKEARGIGYFDAKALIQNRGF